MTVAEVGHMPYDKDINSKGLLKWQSSVQDTLFDDNLSMTAAEPGHLVYERKRNSE
uniref:Uncharacterized protein n=1 Tax=Arion vulgaris TaxID=1028688 RepID=A0A0B7BKM9_9EUPU